MSELPGRPHLDQLRRQARELLRAAADGEQFALTRIHAVSERLSQSAAQLAVAREYGFASWPALHAEVERRLAELPSARDGVRARWSFGGAAAIETAVGTLYPGVLVAGAGKASLEASLMPTSEFLDRFAVPPPPIPTSVRAAWGEAYRDLAGSTISAVALTDDQGTTYALHIQDLHHDPGLSQARGGPVSLTLGVDPVPARDRGWLELRGQPGSAARLVPSPRQDARVSGLAPVPEGRAARELSEQALDLIGLIRPGIDRDEMERYCSDALARAAETQQSAEPGTVGDLPGQLARLCAFLTGRGPADGLPRGWSDIISAANRADGAQQSLDISAALPPVDDVVVRVDSLVSEPESWKVYLRAEPRWWRYNADHDRKWGLMWVAAEDDLGGLYLSQPGHGTVRRDDPEEELVWGFLPRLNPLARALTLTFTHAAEQVTVEFRLPWAGKDLD
jgi:hypothetical protein